MELTTTKITLCVCTTFTALLPAPISMKSGMEILRFLRKDISYSSTRLPKYTRRNIKYLCKTHRIQCKGHIPRNYYSELACHSPKQSPVNVSLILIVRVRRWYSGWDKKIIRKQVDCCKIKRANYFIDISSFLLNCTPQKYYFKQKK